MSVCIFRFHRNSEGSSDLDAVFLIRKPILLQEFLAIFDKYPFRSVKVSDYLHLLNYEDPLSASRERV